MSITYPIQQIRNIGVIAHIDAGKTTTTEGILYHSGRTHRLGKVDQGTTITDWMEQERERGITITAAAVTITWQDSQTQEETQINIIDTPGHIDFTAEVQRSLRVLDGGVVVFDAVSGVEPQSETVWRQADQYGVPRLCFINKMDRVGADYRRTMRMMVDRLEAVPLLVQLPTGSEDDFTGVIDLFRMQALTFGTKAGTEPQVEDIPPDLAIAAREARKSMVEQIIEADEKLFTEFLQGQEPTNHDLYQALRRSVIANRLVPVLLGSALHDQGIQPLLDAIVRYLPSPLDVPLIEGIHPHGGEPTTRRADPGEPFCALVFKVVTDPYVGRLVYLRVYSGALQAGSQVYNATRQRKERMGRLLQMYADKREGLTGCDAGDIIAAVGLKQTFTGDTLCDLEHEILLEDIEFPAPVIRVAVEPQTELEQDRLNKALRKLAEEDPTFQVTHDGQTDQTIISGMGELHLEIITDRLKREFDVQCDVGPPQVAYRETVARVARAEGRYVHQSGGSGRFGVVRLEVAPNESGAGFSFENRTTGAVIPLGFVPSIERGIIGAMKEGVLAGYPVTDVRVTITGGRFHEVDSHKLDFEIAGSIAFKRACKKAGLILLEPIMQVETRVAEEHLGSLIKDFSSRQGSITGIEQQARGVHAITATVPLRNMFGYVTALRSLTSGRGVFSMQFDRYIPIAQPIADEIISAAKDLTGFLKPVRS